MFMSDVTNESVVKLSVMFTQYLCRLLHWRGICSVLELGEFMDDFQKQTHCFKNWICSSP